MKNPVQVISISIFTAILLISKLVLGLSISSHLSTEIYLLFNLIIILTLVVILAIYLVYRSFNFKLISQKLILAILITKIFSLIFEGTSIYLIQNDNYNTSKSIYTLSIILDSIIPFLLLIYIISFKDSSVKFIHTLPSIIIFGGTLALLLIENFFILHNYGGFERYYYDYPNLLITLTVQGCYVIIGGLIFSSVFRSSNFILMRFSPTLVKQNIIILSGFAIFFFIIPILEIVAYYNLVDTYAQVEFLEFFKISSLLLIALPSFYSTEPSFNLIPQSVEKFVVMSENGLPIVSYDFGFTERILHSDLLMTSSLSAIMTYLTHSEIISQKIEFIKFQDRILRFKTKNHLIFVLIVKRQTKVMDSALNVFINEFLKQIDPKLADKNYFKTSDLQNIDSMQLLEECFGTNFKPSSSLPFKQELKNEPPQTILIGRFVMSIVMALSSQRALVFQTTTVLRPNDSDFESILLLFIYASMIYIGSQSYIMKILRDFNYLFYFNVSIFLFLLFLPTGFLSAILVWVFAFLAWGYLIGTWVYDYSRLNKETRYQLFIFGLSLDIAIRFVTLGTEIILSYHDQFSSFGVLIFAIVIFIDRKLRIESSDVSYQEDVNQYSITTLSIGMLFALKYSLNIGFFIRRLNDLNFYKYTVITVIWLILLLVFCSSYLIKRIYDNSNQIFIISVINLVSILLYTDYLEIQILLSLLSPVSIAFLSSFTDQDLMIGKATISSFRMNLLNFLIPVLMFSMIAFTLYGTNDKLLIIPLFVFFLFHLPQGKLNSIKVSDQQSTAIALILLIVISLSIPVFFAQHNLESDFQENVGIMTFNVQYGVSADNVYNPEEITEYIAQTGVAIVGLQEVTRGSLLNGGGDLYFQIKSKLDDIGFRYIAIMETNRDSFVNVLFSKYPIIKSQTRIFPYNVIFERGLIDAEIKVNNQNIQIMVTHLTHVYSEEANKTRISQINFLLENVDRHLPSIVMGDFNLEPTSMEIGFINQTLTDQWKRQIDGYTWPSKLPKMRIDYIFTQFISSSHVEVGNTMTSDHLPVIAWFEL